MNLSSAYFIEKLIQIFLAWEFWMSQDLTHIHPLVTQLSGIPT